MCVVCVTEIKAFIALEMFQWIYVERHTSGSSMAGWPPLGDIPLVAFAAISSRYALFCITNVFKVREFTHFFH